jgi:NitT/TauT family transport system substrate-binding protein
MKQSTAPVAYLDPVYVAYDQGFFNEHGIDMTLTIRPAGGLGPAALVSGDSDVVDLAFNDIANLRNQGKNTIALYDLVTRVTSELVMSNKAIAAQGVSASQPVDQRLKALKGLRLGITSPGAASDVMTRYLLKQAGLNPDTDARIIRLGSFAGLASGLAADQIDAFFGAPPTPEQVQQKGDGKIIVSSAKGEIPALSKFYYVVLTMRSEYVDKNPDAVRGYLAALRQAVDWMKTHREDALKSLQHRLPAVDPATLALGYDAIFGTISKDGRFNPDIVKLTLDAYHQTGVLETVPSTAEGTMWTNKFLQ